MKDIVSLSLLYNQEMELYHVLNRGVGGQDIFHESGDYVRFVHELYEFNDTRSADNLHRSYNRKMKDIVSLSFDRERDLLVNIHAWVAMKNHYHLLLSERKEGGMSRFLRKLNIGYAKFFNEKYKRSGYLFQGRTKKILIENDAQFNYLPHYIHCNPLDYLSGAEGWRIRSKGESVASIDMALAFLRNYRWSSYLDYIGQKNFPSVCLDALLTDSFGDYEKSVTQFLEDDYLDTDVPFMLE